jgi:hypothetical protein
MAFLACQEDQYLIRDQHFACLLTL